MSNVHDPIARIMDEAHVACVEPPLPLPGLGVALLWHRRFTADPGHRWLREILGDVSRVLRH